MKRCSWNSFHNQPQPSDKHKHLVEADAAVRWQFISLPLRVKRRRRDGCRCCGLYSGKLSSVVPSILRRMSTVSEFASCSTTASELPGKLVSRRRAGAWFRWCIRISVVGPTMHVSRAFEAAENRAELDDVVVWRARLTLAISAEDDAVHLNTAPPRPSACHGEECLSAL